MCFLRAYCKVGNCLPLTPRYPTGRDNSVGTATRYGLDGPGIESRWGRDFPQLSRQFLAPKQPPIPVMGKLRPAANFKIIV